MAQPTHGGYWAVSNPTTAALYNSTINRTAAGAPLAPAGGAAAPPAAPPPAAAPDYSSLYNMAMQGPAYQAALAAANAANASYGADRQAGIRGMLTQFGELPAGFNDKYGDIDETTKGAITANTTSGLSLVARMKQARQDAQHSMLAGLAAKGLRRSGARGYGLRKQQLGYDQAYQDAVNKLLGGTGGLYSNYAQNVYQSNNGLAGALQQSIDQMAPFWTQPSTGGGGGGGGGGGAYSLNNSVQPDWQYQSPLNNPANSPGGPH